MRYRITVSKEIAHDNYNEGEIDNLRSVGEDQVFEFSDKDIPEALKETLEKLYLHEVEVKDLYFGDEDGNYLCYDCEEEESIVDDWCHNVPRQEIMADWKAGKINLIAAYYRFKIDEIKPLSRRELGKFGFKF